MCFVQVPQAIKDHYESPPFRLLPEHVKRMQEPLPLHSIPLNTPTAEEQEEVRPRLVKMDMMTIQQRTGERHLLVCIASNCGSTLVNLAPPSPPPPRPPHLLRVCTGHGKSGKLWNFTFSFVMEFEYGSWKVMEND